MRNVTIAAVQMACSEDREENLARAEAFVRTAAGRGAQIVLLPELFETPYFCQIRDAGPRSWARPLAEQEAVTRLSRTAAELGVVLPVSVYERDGDALYNTVVILDADGTVLGHYRKSHIPDGPGYEEKHYFRPGNTGFRVWNTRYGRIGVGICWDQWFPEAARIMALDGAELLLYPSAIGSEPHDPSVDSRSHWQICMRGHAGANMVPLLAANRIGTEQQGASQVTFYGSSFIAGPQGNLLAQADRGTESVISATVDLDRIAAQREEWGLFRDRRPDLYGRIC